MIKNWNYFIACIVFLTVVFIFSSGFSTDPKIIEIWQKTMKFGVSSQRAAVIKSIEDNKASDAYNLTQEALMNDPSADIRGAAAYSLIALKINTESVWLSSLNSESNSDVLRKVVFGVSELKIKTAGPKMYDILTNRISSPKDSVLSASIIRSIGAIGYTAAGDFIFNCLSNTAYSADIRGAAAVALGDLRDPKYVSSLKALIENTGEIREVRMYSAFAIGKSGDPQSVSILIPIIQNEDEDINIRLWAISGLGYVKDPKVVDTLINLVKVDNVRVRMEAVKALGVLKSDAAIEILTYKALYDPEYAVKKEAMTALQNMGVDVANLGKTPNSTTTNGNSQISNMTTNSAKPSAANSTTNTSPKPKSN